MATNVNGFVTLQFTDYYGSTGTVPIYFQVLDSQTVAQLVTDAINLGSLTAPLSGGALTQTSVTLVVETDPTIVTDHNSEIERTGLFNFIQAGTAKSYRDGIAIPAFATTKLVNGKINLADTDVAAWIALIETVSTVFQIVSKFGFTLPTLIDALMSFRKHRKSLTKRSFEE